MVSWWALWWPALLLAGLCGLLGGLMARLLLVSLTGLPDRISAWRQAHPVRFAALCGWGVAVVGVVSGGDAVGGGHQHTQTLLRLEHWVHHTPGLYTGLKFVASWWSAWSGVPGGIFAPALLLGASLGMDVAWLTGAEAHQALIAMGMAAFLAAVIQTPLTAMILVMEMTDGHSMVLSLMASALVASLVSRMISRPLYGTLAEQMLKPWLPTRHP